MRQQIAQLRPANTSAATLVSEVRPFFVDLIIICNTTSSSAVFSIFHDEDGTTYDESTALMFNATLQGGDMAYVDVPRGIANNKVSGTIGVKSGTASALTFTAYGEVYGERV